MQAQALDGGFADPALQAAKVFRGVMEAMARPGTCWQVTGATPPAPLSGAAGAVILTLCDQTTPLYLAGSCDTADVRAWIAFHTGAPLTGAADCSFALGTWDDLMPIDAYPVGTPEYPDRSATLIVELPALTATGATLEGPGIKGQTQLSLPGIAPFHANNRRFPLGCDFIFTSGATVAALPRSTRVS